MYKPCYFLNHYNLHGEQLDLPTLFYQHTEGTRLAILGLKSLRIIHRRGLSLSENSLKAKHKSKVKKFCSPVNFLKTGKSPMKMLSISEYTKMYILRFNLRLEVVRRTGMKFEKYSDNFVLLYLFQNGFFPTSSMVPSIVGNLSTSTYETTVSKPGNNCRKGSWSKPYDYLCLTLNLRLKTLAIGWGSNSITYLAQGRLWAPYCNKKVNK